MGAGRAAEVAGGAGGIGPGPGAVGRPAGAAGGAAGAVGTCLATHVPCACFGTQKNANRYVLCEVCSAWLGLKAYAKVIHLLPSKHCWCCCARAL